MIHSLSDFSEAVFGEEQQGSAVFVLIDESLCELSGKTSFVGRIVVRVHAEKSNAMLHVRERMRKREEGRADLLVSAAGRHLPEGSG